MLAVADGGSSRTERDSDSESTRGRPGDQDQSRPRRFGGRAQRPALRRDRERVGDSGGRSAPADSSAQAAARPRLAVPHPPPRRGCAAATGPLEAGRSRHRPPPAAAPPAGVRARGAGRRPRRPAGPGHGGPCPTTGGRFLPAPPRRPDSGRPSPLAVADADDARARPPSPAAALRGGALTASSEPAAGSALSAAVRTGRSRAWAASDSESGRPGHGRGWPAVAADRH
jgi:hypothetical protein